MSTSKVTLSRWDFWCPPPPVNVGCFCAFVHSSANLFSLPCLLALLCFERWLTFVGIHCPFTCNKRNVVKSLEQSRHVLFRTCLFLVFPRSHHPNSPNSTDLHLGFYLLCQHTNTKDIAGQYATHLPELHYLQLLRPFFQKKTSSKAAFLPPMPVPSVSFLPPSLMGVFVGGDHCRLWEESDHCRRATKKMTRSHATSFNIGLVLISVTKDDHHMIVVIMLMKMMILVMIMLGTVRIKMKMMAQQQIHNWQQLILPLGFRSF